MNNLFHIADLIVKKIKGIISKEEWKELEAWINENPDNKAIFLEATNPRKQLTRLEVYSLFRKEKVWSSIEDELFNTKTINFTPRKYLRYAAAILFPLIISAGILYFFLNRTPETTIANIDTVIKPGSQKATLVLSDGGEIELDEKSFDKVVDGDVKITNENNSLLYADNNADAKIKQLVFNELRTPRGGGYTITLSDGTEVWLNAGSTLKFPVSFSDTTRRVFLEGEAYFQVSHNGKPFIVSSGNMDVRVLGTSFNITAYLDEPEIKTTLVEGKVRIDYTDINTNTSVSRTLAPDEQAVLNRTDSKISVAEVNTAQYTSWLNGKLEFNNETLDVVMKRLARWYDFEYEYENQLAEDYHFTARINNETSISAILDMLEMTCNVKFEMKGKTIVVK